MKIVVNKCFGRFELSDLALKILGTNRCNESEIKRTDENLIEVVETLDEDANGTYAELMVVTIPDEITDWTIEDYDGMETIFFVVGGKIYKA